MAIDKKILEEIRRHKSINNYITEQEATDLPPTDIPPPTDAAAPPPVEGGLPPAPGTPPADAAAPAPPAAPAPQDVVRVPLVVKGLPHLQVEYQVQV